jgi:hypothetical protein
VQVRVDGARLDILRVVTAFECGAIVDLSSERAIFSWPTREDSNL